MKFSDCRTLPRDFYHADISWNHLESYLKEEISYGLDIDPDFQRGHVWTEGQQTAYVEYVMKGGASGKAVYLNCQDYHTGGNTDYVLVDGKQRIEAVRAFMGGYIKAFGLYVWQFDGNMDSLTCRFSWNIANLKNRNDVLQWYIDFNSAGVIHTEDELNRVRGMIKA